MTVYRAPLRDMRFVLTELLGAEAELARLPAHADVNAALIDGVLAQCARFCEGELHALNRTGDEIGCVLENGAVRTPPGYRDAFRRYADAGWCGLALDPAYGGQGLPQVLDTLVQEMVGSANLAFADYAILVSMAAQTIAAHASDRLKALYLPQLAAGAWAATMCMTEPHCGTDLGLLRTRAEPGEDGSWRLYGTKIFISGGDHDLTANIVHLVLARLPDGPAGTRGISLFLVPKFLPGEDGGLSGRNAVGPIGLEQKMGYHASATCTMSFEGAVGWLVGAPHRGLAQMFTMVNAARLATGLQGLCCAETAYQSASAYARERLQGRAPQGARHPEWPADPLVVQPDVRRMLLTARAFTEAARAVAVWTALQIDIARSHPEATRRAEAADLVALLTPAIKAGFSDLGFEACNLCMQVFGGHGYIRANGMEQLVRDVRLAQIQEGANGIQGFDLLARRIAGKDDAGWRRFLALVQDFLGSVGGRPEMAPYAAPLADAVRLLAGTAEALRLRDDRLELAAAGSDFMRLFVLTLFAWMWARIAATALAHAGEDADGFYAAKLALARFYMARILPMAAGWAGAARAGAECLLALPDDRV
jgi:butyryl-CoA dehydrogenase